MFIVCGILFGAAACWTLLWLVIPQLRRHLVDHPNVRSSHIEPTPRGGGLAFAAVSLVASGSALFVGQSCVLLALPLIVVPLAAAGLLDDRFGLPALWRYLVQLLTACFLIALSPLVLFFSPPGVTLNLFQLPLLVLLLIAVTAVINFTNFMDGLDGLVAGCMAVTIAALSVAVSAPWPLWALVGSLFAFLHWNWSPAKVFMGDVGSTFLGAVFTGLVLQAPSWPEAFGLLLVATPLLGDAGFCVIRRVLARQRVLQAHRLHLFQRLHQAGWPHARVSRSYIAATAVLALAMLAGGWPWVFGLAVVELLVGAWLDHRVAVPFAVASQS